MEEIKKVDSIAEEQRVALYHLTEAEFKSIKDKVFRNKKEIAAEIVKQSVLLEKNKQKWRDAKKSGLVNKKEKQRLKNEIFSSQIVMTALRWVFVEDETEEKPKE